jgi:hypothetical protein
VIKQRREENKQLMPLKVSLETPRFFKSRPEPKKMSFVNYAKLLIKLPQRMLINIDMLRISIQSLLLKTASHLYANKLKSPKVMMNQLMIHSQSPQSNSNAFSTEAVCIQMVIDLNQFTKELLLKLKLT